MKLRKLIKELKRRLGKDRENVGLRLELAALYRDSGNTQGAVDTYRDVALTCRDSGRLDEALSACRQALELAPDDVEVRALLIDLKRARRRDDTPTPEPKSGRHPTHSRRRAQFWPSQGEDEPSHPDSDPGPAAAGGRAASEANTGQPRRASTGHESRPSSEMSVAQPRRASTGHGARLPSQPSPGQPGRASTAGGSPGRAPSRPGGETPHRPATGAAESGPAATPAALAREAEESGAVSQSSRFYTPTPLPEPLPLHEAVEDSLMAEQPLRFRKRLSENLPSISLPGDLAGSDDELLSVEPDAAYAAGEVREGIEDLPARRGDEVGPDPAAPEEIDDDEETGVRDASKVRDTVLDGSQTFDELLAAGETSDDGADTVIGELDEVAGALPNAVEEDEPTLVKESPSQAGIPLPPPDDDESDLFSAVPSAETDDATGETERVVVPGAVAGTSDAMTSDAMPREATADGGFLTEEVATEDTSIRPGGPRVRAPSSDLERAGAFTSAPDDPGRQAVLEPLFDTLPGPALAELAAQMIPRQVAAGTHIFREGDPGNACFVLVDGLVRVLQRSPGMNEELPLVEMARLGPGALFGELALLASRRRRGAVQALAECRFYELPRRLLRELAASYAEVGPLLDAFYRSRLVSMLIDSAPLLRSLPEKRRAGLRSRFRRMRRESGDELVSQGARTGGLYLVVQGSIEITQRVSQRRYRLLATLGEGSYVGDMSLLEEGVVAGATVTATGPVEIAALSPADFLAVVKPCQAQWVELRHDAPPDALVESQLLAGETAVV